MGDGWKEKNLREIGSFLNGVNFKRGERGREYNLINVKDLFKKNIIDVDTLDTVELKENKKMDNYFAKKGDLFFGRSSVKREGVGVVAMVDKLKENIIHCGFIIRFRVDDSNVNNYFINYFFRSPIARQQMVNISGGSAIISINQDTLGNFKIKYPESLRTQQKIATILSNYDDLIENNEKRIKILENIAKLIYEEWFVRFKFPGHEKVKRVDSGTEFGMIPEGWEVESIMSYEEFDFINTNIKEFDGEKEYFATANVYALDIIKEGEIVNWNNKPSRAQKEPIINSVWFARMKGSYKVLGFSKTNENIAKSAILSSGFAGFKCEENIFPFLFLNINSKRFETLKNLYATGATQVSINNDGIRSIDIISPKSEIVESFGKLINPLLNQLFLFQIKNQNLRKTRDLLLPKLISGEIDVTELDIELNQEVVNT